MRGFFVPPEQAAASGVRPWWRRAVASPWFHLLLALIVLALIQAFVVKVYRIPSASMEPTLDVGDRILVNRLAYVGAAPGDGDVVVFDTDQEWDAADGRVTTPSFLGWVGDIIGFGPSNAHTLVKRIVATEGETVRCCDSEGRILVDDRPASAPYPEEDYPFEPGVLDCTTRPISARCFPSITVPTRSLLVMGDNRSDSSDSVIACRNRPEARGDECARFVDIDDAIGPVFLRLWPLDRLGPVSG